MTFLRKHGGPLTVLAAGIALAVMAGAVWSMAAEPVLKLQALGVGGTALDSIAVSGLFGDRFCRTEFTIRDGVLTQRFCSTGIDGYGDTMNQENSMADYQPSEGDAWYQPALALSPEGGVQSRYEERLETSEDGSAWCYVRRITACESVRVWAGVIRSRMLISGRIPDDYHLKAMTRTDIVLDVAELSARLGKKLALVQDGGVYGVEVNEDGSYGKPSFSNEDFSQQPYQLWDLENDCAVELPASSGEMSAAVLDGQAYFVPDVGSLWSGETAIYRVTGYDDWFTTAFSEQGTPECGSVEKAVSFQLEEGWKIRALYALEDGQLALVQTRAEGLRIRLFSAATGEELDRRDFTGQGVDFDSLKLTSYIQRDGAALVFSGMEEEQGRMWGVGFIARNWQISATLPLNASRNTEPDRVVAAAPVNGNLVLLLERDWSDLEEEEIPWDQQMCCDLWIYGPDTDAVYRIAAPVLQDRYAQEQGMSVPVRGISGVKIEGREQS